MKFVFYSSLLIALLGCISENKTLVVTFENAEGLMEGDPVILNDYQIGEIVKISINSEYKINAEIILKDSIQLPKDSKFSIGSRDLFTKAIVVTPGNSKTYLTKTDIILGEQSENLNMEKLLDLLTDRINNSKPVRNQDSIISKLEELNKELEEFIQIDGDNIK